MAQSCVLGAFARVMEKKISRRPATTNFPILLEVRREGRSDRVMVAPGVYENVYEFFRGDYAQNASVYARLSAALRKAGIGPTRSLGFFLDDPATTRAEDRRCICGVVIDYPITGPDSYAEGGGRCYTELERYCR
jgi:hypothetical protein